MCDGYQDPLGKIFGALVLALGALILGFLIAYYIFIIQVDNSVDYCHTTKQQMLIRDCKGVSE